MSREPELSDAQNAALAVLLRNESDTAYTRRATRIAAYLELEPGDTLFDCGTGRGFYLQMAGALCPDCTLVGLDYEDHVLRVAQSHLGALPVMLNRGDIHHLPYQDNVFDAVILSEVLEHLTDDHAALRELYRVIKPGAVLAITVPHERFSGWFDPLNRLRQHLRLPPIRRGPFAGIWANHHRLYLPDELAALVREAGFTVEQVEEQTHYTFPGTQFIVYSIGKELYDRNLLPKFILRSTSRYSGTENRGSMLNPINWMLALFRAVDRLNESPRAMAKARTFVNIALKARKPLHEASV
ncbi:MAG: class I SAM-dependent methyltransferase [Chloroflexi bacterium]|nr:class I SAM-dependent methyltransferase [Chloroflexota bacterium]